MTHSVLEHLYPHLPVPLQNVFASAYGWQEARRRLNRDFEHRLDFLEGSQRWSRGEISAYQDAQLCALVAHAYARVPHYRDRMRASGLRPEDVRTVADLHKLPVLTKAEVRAAPQRFIADGTSQRQLVHCHTSGTTGSSLSFYVTKESISFRWAVWWRHRMRFGVVPGDRHVNFTGKRVVPVRQSRPPYWRWNWPMNQILMTMHHMVPGKIASMVEFLDQTPVRFFSGYPSVIHAFARCALEAGLRLKQPPAFVFTGAENVLANQRADIERLTGATMSDQYGFSEGAGNASHCEAFVYHEDFEYGVLECADPIPGDEPGTVRGRILATGFASPAFPFIRYETGDVGVWSDASYTCRCGRQSRVLLRIEGRMDDYVTTPEGRRIMRFDYLFKDTTHVKESQIVQRETDAIIIRIVPTAAYSGRDEAEIRHLVREWISDTLAVSFEYPSEIPREPNGKFRAVKSELRPAR